MITNSDQQTIVNCRLCVASPSFFSHLYCYCCCYCWLRRYVVNSSLTRQTTFCRSNRRQSRSLARCFGIFVWVVGQRRRCYCCWPADRKPWETIRFGWKYLSLPLSPRPPRPTTLSHDDDRQAAVAWFLVWRCSYAVGVCVCVCVYVFVSIWARLSAGRCVCVLSSIHHEMIDRLLTLKGPNRIEWINDQMTEWPNEWINGWEFSKLPINTNTHTYILTVIPI